MQSDPRTSPDVADTVVPPEGTKYFVLFMSWEQVAHVPHGVYHEALPPDTRLHAVVAPWDHNEVPKGMSRVGTHFDSYAMARAFAEDLVEHRWRKWRER